jgi:DNA-binding HxlR family transcriptional regulator
MTTRNAQEGTRMIPGNLHVPEDCRAASEVLGRVGDKWTVLVVSTLGNGPMRFNELRRALGSISQRMLTLTLRALQRDGLVTRTVFPIVPPRVDYELTRLGRIAAGTGQRAGIVGAKEPRWHPGCAPPVRCRQSCQSSGLAGHHSNQPGLEKTLSDLDSPAQEPK